MQIKVYPCGPAIFLSLAMQFVTHSTTEPEMLKAILAHLTGFASDESVLATAKHLADPFAAHLDCLHVSPTPGTLVGMAMGTGSPEVAELSSEVFDALKKVAKQRRHRAHQTFAEFCKREGIAHLASPPAHGRVTGAWHESEGGDVERLITEVRFRDLVVVAGSRMGQDGLSSRELGSVILAGGRPVVLVPPKPSTARIRTIAIAWKDSPEAARAIMAALPLLSKAARVVLLSANEENDKAMECVACSDSVAGHLRWHGLSVEARYVIPAGRSIPDAVLETAHDIGADLLVMGAYGRNRLSEMIFGGFTQRVLSGTDLPVLLFH